MTLNSTSSVGLKLKMMIGMGLGRNVIVENLVIFFLARHKALAAEGTSKQLSSPLTTDDLIKDLI